VHSINATGNQITKINAQFEQDNTSHSSFFSPSAKTSNKKSSSTWILLCADSQRCGHGIHQRRQSLNLSQVYTWYHYPREGIEASRSLLGSDWNPDNPIEDLWLGFKECQRFATAATEPILPYAVLVSQRINLSVSDRLILAWSARA
jgi:hypothetical protein